ncbi:MAG: aspartyl/asparaginyl beta-hydroxylase domain-containing protein [Hellea sp.]
MPDRLKLPLSFDGALLQRDLAILDSFDWIDHFVKRNYEGDWTVLPLRGTKGAQHPIMSIYSAPGETEYEDTAILGQCAYFQSVLRAFPFKLYAVRLMALTPGSIIKPHHDHDLSIEDGFARFHIPITTNADVSFTLNDQAVNMQVGECWYLRLSDTHSVKNQGDETRVHMVIDAPVTPEMLAFMGLVEPHNSHN